MMQITVKTITGKSFPLEVESSDTILMVKNKILERDGTPIEQQELIFNSIRLVSGYSLRYYGITAGSTIFLTTRLYGD